jgi:hypothetical protein
LAARVFNGRIPYLSAAINTSTLLKAAWFSGSVFSGLFSETDESDSWPEIASSDMATLILNYVPILAILPEIEER